MTPRRLSVPVLATALIVVCIAAAIAGAYWWRPSPPAIEAPAAAVAAPAPAPDASQYREIEWQTLLPKGWDPMAPFKGLPLDKMEDDDPRAAIAMDKARELWKSAPVDSTLDGATVRLPGYVVSLDGEGETIREFLLVPYFGACIHMPPPPSNQVVHVRTNRPLEGLRTMDTVWISGVMRVERAETMMGDAGYAMQDAGVERYQQ